MQGSVRLFLLTILFKSGGLRILDRPAEPKLVGLVGEETHDGRGEPVGNLPDQQDHAAVRVVKVQHLQEWRVL